jgi:long-subunit fatty acid transport protein
VTQNEQVSVILRVLAGQKRKISLRKRNEEEYLCGFPGSPLGWWISLGLSYELNEIWTLMAGFGYDETPVPDSTLLFDLPDSAAYLYSVSARYQVNERMETGAGYLYDYKENRSATNARLNGTFTDSAAHLLTMGLTYTF